MKEILDYRVSGNGHPVVFLHGFLESNSMWKHIELPSTIKQICIDLPGHGASISHKVSSISAMSDAVRTVVDSLNVSSYYVVGHSMGGYVALELLKNDSRCEQLLLLNSNFWADSAQKKIDRKRVANIVQENKSLFLYEAIPNLFLNPEASHVEVKELIEEANLMSSEAIGQASIAMSNRKDYSSFVQEENEHIFIVQGKEDSIVPLQMMRDSAESTGVSIQELEGCGHMAHIEKPLILAKIIMDWIKKKRKP